MFPDDEIIDRGKMENCDQEKEISTTQASVEKIQMSGGLFFFFRILSRLIRLSERVTFFTSSFAGSVLMAAL